MFSTLLTILALTGFQEEMDLRHFDEAWIMADESDSLKAEVLSESGLVEAAVMLRTLMWVEDPSPDNFVALWRDIANSESSCVLNSLFRSELEHLSITDWVATILLDLYEIAFLLDDRATCKNIAEQISDVFPGSPEAACIAGDLFYYYYSNSVRDDDSAKVIALEEFITDAGPYSDLWRSKAYRYQLRAVTETADSLQWHDYLDRWLEGCPDDPVACLTGAAMYIEKDSAWVTALELADEGLQYMEDWHPPGMSEDEFVLERQALRNNLIFRRCQALHGTGQSGRASEELAPLLNPLLYPMDDYHSPAPFFWLAGEIALEQGDTLQAALEYIQAASLGDVVNRWSGKSEERLAQLSPENDFLEWCREITDYDGPVFMDITGLLGPDSLIAGTRVAWGDFDSDGYPDLLLGRRLYSNENGIGFTDVTEESGFSQSRGTGGIFGDLDRDGDLDIITSGMPVQVLFNSNGSFTDVTHRLGVFPSGHRVEGVGLLDWNADGWLDVYLASYEVPGTTGEGTEDRFYLGGPDGFHEVSDSLGMIPFRETPLCGRGVSPCDFDRDGDVDVFVSNYRLQENFLWSNTSNGALNSSLETGTAGHCVDGRRGHTIGSAWGDFDCDGDWDLFCANLAHPRYIDFSNRSELLCNTGNSFQDTRANAGIRFEETHSNPLWGDFNCDGWLDLYITSVYEDRRSFLYLGSESGVFTDVTFLSGARTFNGWGASAADLDRDGRLDLAVGSGSGPALLRNVTEPTGAWLLVNIEAPEGTNTSATGCVVEITDGNRTWLRQVEGGSGTTSQSEGTLHFGLPHSGQYSWKMFVPGEQEPITAGTGVLPGEIITLP